MSHAAAVRGKKASQVSVGGIVLGLGEWLTVTGGGGGGGELFLRIDRDDFFGAAAAKASVSASMTFHNQTNHDNRLPGYGRMQAMHCTYCLAMPTMCRGIGNAHPMGRTS